MNPTRAWAEMANAVERQMFVCVRMGQGVELIALKGGKSGPGEIALRLPGGLHDHRLEGPWSGIRVGHFERASEKDVLYLTVSAEPEYQVVFGHLCDDLASQMEGSRDGYEAEARMLSHLRLWSGFLRPAATRLETRAIRGLYGELRFLEDILAPTVGWRAASSAWEGPAGAAKDINLQPRLEIDVKTTAEPDQIATISSLEQLDVQPETTMVVAQAVVAEGSGERLIDVAERILLAADAGGGGGLMRARLSQSGALNADNEDLHLHLLSWRFHLVNDPGFPRILRSSLHPSVRQCIYQIDLAAHNGYRPPMNEVVEMIHTALEKRDEQ